MTSKKNLKQNYAIATAYASLHNTFHNDNDE